MEIQFDKRIDVQKDRICCLDHIIKKNFLFNKIYSCIVGSRFIYTLKMRPKENRFDNHWLSQNFSSRVKHFRYVNCNQCKIQPYLIIQYLYMGRIPTLKTLLEASTSAFRNLFLPQPPFWSGLSGSAPPRKTSSGSSTPTQCLLLQKSITINDNCSIPWPYD